MQGANLFRGFLLILCVAGFSAMAETNEIERAMVTDSDGDGATDWEEWLARTNPGDSNSCFEIISIEDPAVGPVIRWKSVGSLSYRIRWCDTVAGLGVGGETEVVVASGGAPPWNGTESVATNATTTGARFVSVELVVPQELDDTVADLATFE